MGRSNRPLWRYGIFQIPLILLAIFLILATLFWLLGLGRPKVAVAVAIDLSGSTYQNQAFNAPGSIMDREVQAVKAYVGKNTTQILSEPNQVQIFGFAGEIVPLTSNFDTDGQKIIAELTANLKPEIAPIIGGGTNIDRAIQATTEKLTTITDRCREILLVTDGIASVNTQVVTNSINNRVRINSVVVGSQAPELQIASLLTGGVYLSADAAVLEVLFIDKFFSRFNSNLRWLVLWLGAAWIALMWLLTLPLDRWVLQGIFKLPWNLSGRLAISNALFWTTLTPIIVWQIIRILNLPFFRAC